jgi:hypothetical protein
MKETKDSLPALINEHLSRRPGMQPRDVYKLLYQSVRGPEHIIASPQAFTQWLREEWEGLDLTYPDPLYESIRPDGSLLRLNLRPYKAAGGGLEDLAEACLETGRRAWGTQGDLEIAWRDLLAGWRKQPRPGMSLEDYEAFTYWLESQGFPAVHHSEPYRSLYHPAYRLVAAHLLLNMDDTRL